MFLKYVLSQGLAGSHHGTVLVPWARGARTEGKTHGTSAVPWLLTRCTKLKRSRKNPAEAFPIKASDHSAAQSLSAQRDAGSIDAHREARRLREEMGGLEVPRSF